MDQQIKNSDPESLGIFIIFIRGILEFLLTDFFYLCPIGIVSSIRLDALLVSFYHLLLFIFILLFLSRQY